MKRVVSFGEIMLRLSTESSLRYKQSHNFQIHFGGAESNVAASLAQLGIDAQFVSRVPDNDLGDMATMELKKWGVGTNFLQKGGDRLGIYFLESGAVNRPSRVIYDRDHSAFSEIEPNTINWDEIFENTEWFHWTGITPAVSENAAIVCKEAILKAREKNICVSTDLNYRKNLWNYGKTAQEVMPELVSLCDIVMGNEEDAHKVLGIKLQASDISKGKINSEDYLSVSQQIIKQYPNVRKVITSLRSSINANHNKWAGVLYDGTNLLRSKEYDITHIIDRVGGGDSFMAGLIYGMLSYNDDQKALEFAVAASALKHTVSGDFNILTVNEVEKLVAGDGSGRVNR